MDDIKLQNFAREYPGSPFPKYESLTEQQAEEIRRRVQTQLGLPAGASPLDLVRNLSERSTTVSQLNAEDENFSLRAILQEAGVEPRSKVFINWHRFDNIDEIGLDDLSEYFDDIWYPAVDDIDIFDESLQWILSVGYSGNVHLLKF